MDASESERMRERGEFHQSGAFSTQVEFVGFSRENERNGSRAKHSASLEDVLGSATSQNKGTSGETERHEVGCLVGFRQVLAQLKESPKYLQLVPQGQIVQLRQKKV